MSHWKYDEDMVQRLQDSEERRLSSEPNNGGSAFPGPWDKQNGRTVSYPGMSLRAYFAGQALAALVGNPDHHADYDVDAAHSVKLADALIKELGE